MADENIVDDEYKGTGRFASAVGRSTTDGAVGKIAGAVVAGGGVALMGAQNILEKGFAATAKQSKIGAALVGAGSLMGVGGFIHGAYKGWTNAAAAQKQFAEQKAEIATLKKEVATQKAVLGKFTESEVSRAEKQGTQAHSKI